MNTSNVCAARRRQTNTRNVRIAQLAAAVIMILATGCSSAVSSSPKPEEPDILVAAIPTVDLASLYIAQADGLFAQQGLHVSIEKIPSSAAIIADQLKGQIDIGAGSYVGYIAAQAAGPGSTSWPRPRS